LGRHPHPLFTLFSLFRHSDDHDIPLIKDLF
jgi:hypothetical protein